MTACFLLECKMKGFTVAFIQGTRRGNAAELVSNWNTGLSFVYLFIYFNLYDHGEKNPNPIIYFLGFRKVFCCNF